MNLLEETPPIWRLLTLFVFYQLTRPSAHSSQDLHHPITRSMLFRDLLTPLHIGNGTPLTKLGPHFMLQLPRLAPLALLLTLPSAALVQERASPRNPAAFPGPT